MKISFIGDQEKLRAGIAELAPVLGIEIAQDGYIFEIKRVEEPTLFVRLAEKRGEIVYAEPCQFYRALGLAVEHIRDGEESFCIEEQPQFNMNGPMFDMSQGNAAFNVKTLKSVIRQLALMGLNTLMLYCEDNFEVQNRPFFGYMRPTYTECDMRELDDYAYSLGIEMIPCIQTLAHLTDALRWKCFRPFKDYADCLMVGNEQTYAFLRDVITSASRPFRTKKIHIGMDEAWSLGRGKYMDAFGYCDPSKIMREHLARVMEIIRELGLEPMMWDDMFFRAFNGGKYYLADANIPDEAVALVPEEMRCIYWDYYHLTHEEYEGFMAQHQRLCKKMIFAGGCWTWRGFALSWDKTAATTAAALDTCKKLGIKDVFMTTWGDNGTECLSNTNLIGCQLYAEHGYAETFDFEKFKKRFFFCTGGHVEDFARLQYLDLNEETARLDDDPAAYNTSKWVMWQDILMGLFDANIKGAALDVHYATLAEQLREAKGRNGQFDGMFEFNQNVAHVLSLKAHMGQRLTAAYRKGDRDTLTKIAQQELPDLSCRVKLLRDVHMKNWFELYKPIGWEIMDMRYGALLARIDSAAREVNAYLAGELDRIEELEVERLQYNDYPSACKVNEYGKIVSASRIAPQNVE